MREVSGFKIGHMRNNIEELINLRDLGIQGIHSKAPKVLYVNWLAPKPRWTKLNTDGTALRSPGVAECGVFRNSRGFVRSCYWSLLGVSFAYEAELWGVIKGVCFAGYYGWDYLWIESDSTFIVYLLNQKTLQVPWTI